LLPSSPSTETHQKNKRKKEKTKKDTARKLATKCTPQAKQIEKAWKAGHSSLSLCAKEQRTCRRAVDKRERARGLQKIEEDEVPKRGTLKTTTCRAVKKATRDREKGLPIASKMKFPNGNAESDGLRTPPLARSRRFWRNCLGRRNFFPKYLSYPRFFSGLLRMPMKL
jgi:hypothetical protein